MKPPCRSQTMQCHTKTYLFIIYILPVYSSKETVTHYFFCIIWASTKSKESWGKKQHMLNFYREVKLLLWLEKLPFLFDCLGTILTQLICNFHPFNMNSDDLERRCDSGSIHAMVCSFWLIQLHCSLLSMMSFISNSLTLKTYLSFVCLKDQLMS